MLLMPKMRSLLVIVVLMAGLCAVLVHTHPAAAKTGGSVKAPDPESLPPDTFRKLAQALYQRGDKAENRLQRKFFYNGNITCNDGSVAGYYIRRNYNSKRWIIFLEGGWICHDDMSCSERRVREHHRMSSDRWPSVKTVGGILSADPSENPHFADANHVFVPYCSSDAWSGYASGRPASAEAATNTGDLAFMGGNIVREVIRELADFQQLLFGRELYLAGSSAGGIGVMMNIDSVAGMVGRAGLRVRGIVDSGWFLDNDPFAAVECSAGKGKCSVVQNLQQGVRLWKARVPAACQQNFPGEAWKCFLGYKLFPFIKTPLFIFQWQFDKFQLYADNVAIPASRDQWNYIHQMGNNLRGTFHNLSAVFSPACIAHEVITKSDWTSVNVEGVTLPDALQCWAQSLPDAHLDLGSDLAIRDQLGHSGNEVFSSGNNRPRSVSMLADEPLTTFKTGSNLVRAIDASSDMDSTRNSISTRLQKNREPNRSDRQLELKTNTRSGLGISSSRENNRLRRKRRRMRQLKQRCRQGDSESCQKLKRMIQHQSQHEPELFDEDQIDLDDEIFNSDLVRSLDRRSSKRRQRRKNNNGNKKKVETEEELKRKRDRKLKKQEEKEERKRKRKERKEKRRLLKRQRRKELREKRRKLEEESSKQVGVEKRHALNVEKRHTLNVRSVTEAPTCQFKLIDSCTWPHCNPSCPKLKNPETGQDIDFLTLLQSFGLDMSSVAKALGVDITTLNNMDREVLIHLLTSQGNTD